MQLRIRHPRSRNNRTTKKRKRRFVNLMVLRSVPTIRCRMPINRTIRPYRSIFNSCSNRPFILRLLSRNTRIHSNIHIRVTNQLVRCRSPKPRRNNHHRNSTLLLTTQRIRSTTVRRVPGTGTLDRNHSAAVSILNQRPCIFNQRNRLINSIHIRVLNFQILRRTTSRQNRPISQRNLRVRPTHNLITNRHAVRR